MTFCMSFMFRLKLPRLAILSFSVAIRLFPEAIAVLSSSCGFCGPRADTKCGRVMWSRLRVVYTPLLVTTPRLASS